MGLTRDRIRCLFTSTFGVLGTVAWLLRFDRIDTGEKWRDRLREIVTKPIPERREEKDSYERLIREVLPKSLYDLTSPPDESADEYELPFEIVKKVQWIFTDVLCCLRHAE